MSCAHCGEAAIGDELYCRSCGLAFIPDRPAAPAPTGPAPAAAAALPVPPGAVTQLSRNWALAAHLTAVAGALLGGIAAFVGPLVVLLTRHDDAFAAEHARQTLNFNLSVLLYALVGGIAAVVLVVLTLGFALVAVLPLAAVGLIAYFVVSAVGAVAAAKGRPFRYPLALPLVR